jgi:hypothetical protein
MEYAACIGVHTARFIVPVQLDPTLSPDQSRGTIGHMLADSIERLMTESNFNGALLKPIISDLNRSAAILKTLNSGPQTLIKADHLGPQQVDSDPPNPKPQTLNVADSSSVAAQLGTERCPTMERGLLTYGANAERRHLKSTLSR